MLAHARRFPGTPCLYKRTKSWPPWPRCACQLNTRCSAASPMEDILRISLAPPDISSAGRPKILWPAADWRWPPLRLGHRPKSTREPRRRPPSSEGQRRNSQNLTTRDNPNHQMGDFNGFHHEKYGSNWSNNQKWWFSMVQQITIGISQSKMAKHEDLSLKREIWSLKNNLFWGVTMFSENLKAPQNKNAIS